MEERLEPCVAPDRWHYLVVKDGEVLLVEETIAAP
jgi:hypothetical protein